MSYLRILVFAIVVACSLYASFILVYKKVDAETVQHLRDDVKAVIESNLATLHLAANEELASQPAVIEKHTSETTMNGDASDHHADAVDAETATAHEEATPEKSVVVSVEKVETEEQKACRDFVEKNAVVPGQSWGTLNAEQQKAWTRYNCDSLVQAATDKVAQIVAVDNLDRSEAAAIAAAKLIAEKSRKKDKKKDKKKDSAIPALPAVDKDNSAWCDDVKAKYGVIPMRSWGKLPMNYIEQWKGRRCDLVFTTKRMGLRPISFCPDHNNSNSTVSSDKKKSKAPVHSNQVPSLPLIAIMAATTTRKVSKPSTKNLSLFMYLLPSMIRTLDCGFRYEYVLGYDKGDPFYDSAEGMAEVNAWFKSNIQSPMHRNGISVTLRLVKVNNTLKKPGPVFLEMARAAYSAGADYFYRINDDTELMVNWPAKFVAGMQKLSKPYGVIGPLCNQGNERILTHDFTTRLHMEIFEMNYYPPELVDWWMDDWISLVYGKERTFKAKSVPVMHHTGAHGQRYQVDQANSHKLSALVESGRLKIRQWMLTHNVPEHELKQFDTDVYRSFVHKDI